MSNSLGSAHLANSKSSQTGGLNIAIGIAFIARVNSSIIFVPTSYLSSMLQVYYPCFYIMGPIEVIQDRATWFRSITGKIKSLLSKTRKAKKLFSIVR
jgi:hypothetical protein